MNIVVLDGYTLNPGDLSWSGLEKLGGLTVYDRTPAELVAERAQDADIVLTNKTVLSAATIAALPRLKYIGVLATGYNVVDTGAAKQRGIPVSNVPTYGTGSVAQFVFALLLELCNRVQLHADAVRQGEWSRCDDFCFTKSPLVELEGKTLGLIGFGRIGRRTAQIAAAFGMRIAVHSKSPKSLEGFGDAQWASLDDTLTMSDVVSLHCPLTLETEGLIDATRLSRMKRSAFLINTSRGGLIVDRDLADALNAGTIAGAGLDVLSVEPPTPDNPLLAARNCIITPHIAWATQESRARLMDIAVHNVAAFLAGKPENVVNG